MDDSYSAEHDTIREFLSWLGDDPFRGGLLETPRRFLKAWSFWASGYTKDPRDVFKVFDDGAEKANEMVMVGPIPMFSHCEHHLAPFFGVVFIGYIPDGKIIGLSKFSRLIEVFARRLQVQERLTNQIVDAIMDNLTPRGCGCVIMARHLCMESRGVQTIGTITTTSALRGNFKEVPEVRSEFLSLVQTAAQGVKTL